MSKLMMLASIATGTLILATAEPVARADTATLDSPLDPDHANCTIHGVSPASWGGPALKFCIYQDGVAGGEYFFSLHKAGRDLNDRYAMGPPFGWGGTARLYRWNAASSTWEKRQTKDVSAGSYGVNFDVEVPGNGDPNTVVYPVLYSVQFDSKRGGTAWAGTIRIDPG